MKNKGIFHWLLLGALVLGACALTPRWAYAGGPPPKDPNGSSSAAGGYSWTGLYIGVNLGYGWGTADTRFTPLPDATTFINLAPTTLRPDPAGVIGGGQVGYNRQFGHFVLGVEADINGSAMDGTAVLSPIIQNNGTPFPGAGNHLLAHQDTNWYMTFRPRVGYVPTERLMVYGTGGLAVGHVNFAADSDFRPVGTEHYPAAFDDTKAGWVAGAGAELAIKDHWSLKGEFLHYDLGGQSFTANPAIPLPPFQVRYHWETTANLVRFGVNYRF